jgi:hypothetical protein
VQIIVPTPDDYLGRSDEDLDDSVATHTISGNEINKYDPACHLDRGRPLNNFSSPNALVRTPLKFKGRDRLDSEDACPISPEMRDRIDRVFLQFSQGQLYPINAADASVSQNDAGHTLRDACGDTPKPLLASPEDLTTAEATTEQEMPEQEQSTVPNRDLKQIQDEIPQADVSVKTVTKLSAPCQAVSTENESLPLSTLENNGSLLSGDDAREITLANNDPPLAGDDTTETGCLQDNGLELEP